MIDLGGIIFHSTLNITLEVELYREHFTYIR